MDIKSAFAFRECAACEAKSDTPTLCPSCLHNRATIVDLQAKVRALTAALGIANSCTDALLELAVRFRKSAANNGPQ